MCKRETKKIRKIVWVKKLGLKTRFRGLKPKVVGFG